MILHDAAAKIADLLPYVPLIGLYAETHYRFKYFPFSLYYRREPEIVIDAPNRLEPGMRLPVTVIVKDAHIFPVEIHDVRLMSLSAKNNTRARFGIHEKITSPFWHKILEFDVEDLEPGPAHLDAQLSYTCGGRTKELFFDNYVGMPQNEVGGLGRKLLAFYKAEHHYPLLPGWQAGELHCHTSYGPDQVEFGAPLEAIQRTAEALGLSWVALTDHSYNLDDLSDNYLKPDPKLRKWNKLWKEAERLSKHSGVKLLPGEELSCRNSLGKNVHMIILGNREFLHGSGDGAEKWFRTRSEFSVSEALERISPDALAVAAHPLVPTPFLEKLLVGRGEWTADDLRHPRLDGWQIVNGSLNGGYAEGKDLWRKELGSGRNIKIFGGNDAHGNFNRFRQVKIPMIKLQEHFENLFGDFTTRVKSKARDSKGILNALKIAPIAISNGPSAEIIPVRDRLRILWLTTPEYGHVKELILIRGKPHGEESVSLHSDLSSEDRYSGEIVLQSPPDAEYVRVELTTHNDELDADYYSIGNPVALHDSRQRSR